MNGRMYRVPQNESYPLFRFLEDGTRCVLPYDYTPYTVYGDLVVPNGTWVMERPCFGHTWLVGATWAEIRDVHIDKRPGQQRLLWMADKPFGFVGSEKADWRLDIDIQVPKGSQLLRYARQIHKGELGQGVPIPKLKFAREHPGNARKYHTFARNRDQRRNPFRWARLSDATAAAGISAHQLMRSYWPFTGTSYDSASQRSGELLHVRYGATARDISDQEIPHSYLTFEELSKQIMGGRLPDIWIRAGLANTFLRLQALGYKPTTAPVA